MCLGCLVKAPDMPLPREESVHEGATSVAALPWATEPQVRPMERIVRLVTCEDTLQQSFEGCYYSIMASKAAWPLQKSWP